MQLREKNDRLLNNQLEIWSFEPNIETYSFLPDHGFQDMVVLPGSFYIDQALQFASSKLNYSELYLTDINYRQLFLIGGKEEKLHFSTNIGESATEIWCSQRGDSEPNGSLVSLSIPHSVPDRSIIEDLDLDSVNSEQPEILSGQDCYERLLANGNQYGPQFQVVDQVWLGERTALGKIKLSNKVSSEIQQFAVHPVLLDACVQVLASLTSSAGKTFVLGGFQEVRLIRTIQDDFYCKAVLNERQDSANVFLYDVNGEHFGSLIGASYSFLDHSTKIASTKLVITSTFTADPLQGSLAFWSSTLKLPFNIEIAPYNQVFQELLDPSSQTRSNAQGANILLLGLEDWMRKGHQLQSNFSGPELAAIIGEQDSYVLPNGLKIAHLNQYETEYLYQEIFVDQSYNKHDIVIKDGDCILDIGANIGMFTLWVNQQCKNPRVYAYEPSPVVHEILSANAQLYGSNVKAFAYGVADQKREAEFTFYEKSSVFSSFNADAELDKEAISAVVRNMLRESSTADTGALDAYLDEIMVDRMQSKNFTCQLISIADIIEENNLESIDLLKIDAEKSELPILHGIADDNWPKIKQIVMEVHDTEGPVIAEVKEILEKRGFEFHIEEEDLLQHSGLYNIFATRKGQVSQEEADNRWEEVEKNINDLSATLESVAANSSVPYLVMVAPRSPGVKEIQELENRYQKLEDLLLSRISKVKNLHAFGSSEVDRYYEVPEYFDPEGNEIGHVPYTNEYFAALGSTVARKFYSLHSTPRKVIVLDCDNTLWKGVVGEEGVQGVTIDEEYKFLHDFMIQQTKEGMILCLCSKNAEQDVLDIFQQRDDMLLSLDHIVAHKINWEAKSDNIKILAQELNLGLDSFIFIDDNAMETAEVSAACPSVLTFTLPQDPLKIPEFLKNIWAFDHMEVTKEDQQRTKMYQQNIQREHLKEESLTLKDFIGSLNLDITIEEPTSEDFPRISQLTHRTNQFNLTTIRRSESEIRKLLKSDELHALTVRVRDRFGDYGLVGVILYKLQQAALHVDTFLLSCRVLGKGVAHKMVQTLGEKASNQGLEKVVLNFIPTTKNLPALKFLESIATEFMSDLETGHRFDLPVAIAKTLAFDPDAGQPASDSQDLSSTVQSPVLVSNQILAEIAGELSTPAAILKQIQSSHAVVDVKVSSAEYIAPENDLEKAIAEIWSQVLNSSNIGINDNFFEIGGTSLKGVQLVALLKRNLNLDISIVNLFESPSISSMVSTLQGDSSSTVNAETSRQRGANRRERKRGRNRR
ncbi:MAG: FkbM family methyltransferase [Cyclobacteriaceae bacterium]